MKIFRNTDNIIINRPVGTIGIFDGVHLAHQAVIKKLIETSGRLSGESTIITLWPHPRIVLNHQADRTKLLNTLDEKIERLEKTGVENLVVIPFNLELASMGFEVFIKEILLNKIGIIHLVVGINHQFGHNRQGNYENLQKFSSDLHFGLSKQEPFMINQAKISSSLIRRLITEGNIEQANDYLGYRYFISGKVMRGNGIGREIGFPTANLEVADVNKLIPPKGVYAVMVSHEGNLYRGMMNIGCRPTLNPDCLQDILEVNLFDYQGDLYGKLLKIMFIGKIRDEKKFSSVESLRQQIQDDKQLINKILNSIKIEL